MGLAVVVLVLVDEVEEVEQDEEARDKSTLSIVGGGTRLLYDRSSTTEAEAGAPAPGSSHTCIGFGIIITAAVVVLRRCGDGEDGRVVLLLVVLPPTAAVWSFASSSTMPPVPVIDCES